MGIRSNYGDSFPEIDPRDNFASISTVLAKTGYYFLSFGQESIQWPNILRRKTQKREQPADNRRNFAVSTRQNNSLKDT